MKRVLSILFALVMALSITAPAAALQQSGDWTYVVVGREAYIAAYGGSDAVLVIPESLGGYPVTAIGDDAIAGVPSLQTVYLPESITAVGARNFAECPALATVFLPSGLVSCGEGCFDGSSSELALYRGGVPVTLQELLDGPAEQGFQPPAEDAARRQRALSHYFKDGVLMQFAEVETIPVYSGPGTDYFRAANGKAAVNTAGSIYGTYYVLRRNAKWILIAYGTSAGASRYGWIQYKYSYGFNPGTYADVVNSMNDRWFNETAIVRADTPLYDYTDPAMGAVTTVPAGAEVTYFAVRGGTWAYVEATTEIGMTRGFVNVDDLVF